MWNKELVEVLITKYQEHENLYNVRSPLYIDRVKRSNSLFEICKDLKEVNNNITVEAIKKKIHTLRSQYIKELREVSNSMRSGAGAEDVYEAKLWCFDQLKFLQPHCAVRKSTTNISINNETDERSIEEYVLPDVAKKTLTPPSCSKRKRTSKLDEKMDNVKSLLVKRLEERTLYDWFGKEVVFEVNSIKDKKLQRDTVWKIQKILREASIEDAKISEYQSEEFNLERTRISDTQSSFGSNSFVEKPSCSSFSSKRSAPYIPKQTCNTTKAHLPPSPDILEISFEGIFDDEDY